MATIVEKINPPKIVDELKLFLIDSWYVKDKGVVLMFVIRGGYLKKGD